MKFFRQTKETKRKISFFVALAMVISLLPVSPVAKAAEKTGETVQLGNLKVYSNVSGASVSVATGAGVLTGEAVITVATSASKAISSASLDIEITTGSSFSTGNTDFQYVGSIVTTASAVTSNAAIEGCGNGTTSNNGKTVTYKYSIGNVSSGKIEFKVTGIKKQTYVKISGTVELKDNKKPSATPSETTSGGATSAAPSTSPSATASGGATSAPPSASPSSPTSGGATSAPPSASPSTTPSTAPSPTNGGSSSNGGGGGYVPSISAAPSATPGASASAAPSGSAVPSGSANPSDTGTGNTSEPTKTPGTTATQKPDNDKDDTTGGSTSSVKVGKKVTVSGSKYKVTAVKGTRTVQFTSGKKNAKSVVIPSTVKVSGKNYKVTTIAKNAFKGNKKLKKVTIGANINKIGANAFKGCGKLKSIIIKTKKLTAKKVGNNAFKGINKKATIKVPKAKVKAYKKIVKAKGAGKNVKVKK